MTKWTFAGMPNREDRNPVRRGTLDPIVDLVAVGSLAVDAIGMGEADDWCAQLRASVGKPVDPPVDRSDDGRHVGRVLFLPEVGDSAEVILGARRPAHPKHASRPPRSARLR